MSNLNTPKSLLAATSRVKVSSTLDKSSGRKNLTDGSPESCWSSKEGVPQYIHISFDTPINVHVVHLTFQGGFVGTRCSIQARRNGAQDFMSVHTIYPDDVNRMQSFSIPRSTAESGEGQEGVHEVKLVFEESSDFFGRITIYDLQIDGTECLHDSRDSERVENVREFKNESQ